MSSFIDFIVTTIGSSAIVLLVINTFLKDGIKNYFNKKLNEHTHDLNRKMHDFSIMANKKFEYYALIHEEFLTIAGDIAIMLKGELWNNNHSIYFEDNMERLFIKHINPFTEKLIIMDVLIQKSSLYSSDKVMYELVKFNFDLQYLGKNLMSYLTEKYDITEIESNVEIMDKESIEKLKDELVKNFNQITLLMRKEITFSDYEENKVFK